MLNQFSWTNYFATVSLLLVVYYLFVAIKFFSTELRLVVLRKSNFLKRSANKEAVTTNDLGVNSKALKTQISLFNYDNRYAQPRQTEDVVFQQVEALAARLKETIAQAVSNNVVKEDFILSLQIVLRKYGFLKSTGFSVAINNLIASECEKHGFINLDEEERVMLWNG